MPISINTNLNALRAVRRLDQAGHARENAFERLSSGVRINQASDDAAGLAVATSLNVQSRVYTQAIRNVNDGVSYLNIADGATSELKNVLIRLRELATQASTGSLSNAQRRSVDKEAQSLQSEYNRIIDTSKYNGLSVLSGTTISIQVGSGSDAVIQVGATGPATVIAGDGTFQARQSYQVGSNPSSVKTVDLNGDGILDIVSSESASNTVSVFIGNGNGTFQARRSLTAGSNPASLSTGDFDGDGVIDIASVEASSNSVSIFLGNGDASFEARRVLSTGLSPRSIVSDDFNDDGILDLATTDYSSNGVSILLGNGDGTFRARLSASTGTGPSPIASVDINGDGEADILSYDITGFTLSVLLGNGNGTFQANSSFVAPVNYSFVVTDVNGDSNPDVVTADFANNSASVLLGNGDGTFAAKRSFLQTGVAFAITAADLNGDGNQDVITSNTFFDAVRINFGNGDGTFQAGATFESGLDPQSVTVGDMNGDGILDVVTGDGNSSSVSVLLGNGGPTTYVRGLRRLSGISVSTRSAALSAQSTLDNYFTDVSRVSGFIGIGLSRLSVAGATLESGAEAYRAAEGRIRDADIAEEAAVLVSTGILQQAAAAVLAQAAREPDLVLRLLAP